MSIEQIDSFFTQHGKHLFAGNIKKSLTSPFKDHEQFPILVDILSRKNNHHALLQMHFSNKMHLTFLESFLQHLTHENITHTLRNAELIYLNMENVVFSITQQICIESDFQKLRDTLDKSDKYLLFAMTNTSLFNKDNKQDDLLRRQFETLLTHPRCRFIFLKSATQDQIPKYLKDYLTTLIIPYPSQNDVINILKQQRVELEHFHHVVIPDDVLTHACSLAERYLSTSDVFDKSLLLLDSSAARASAMEVADTQHVSKPVLTNAILTAVLSSWTKIPAANLQINKLKLNECLLGLQEKVFGQDAGLMLITQELQQAHAHLHQDSPFCSFLFAGPKHSGRKTTAIAMTEQLFKHQNALFFAQILPGTPSLSEIKLKSCHDKSYSLLKDVIQQTPFAVIFFDEIDKAPAHILDGLSEVLATGFLHDEEGNQYNFRQAIIILNTTLGSTRLLDIAKDFAKEEDTGTLDLLQLVMQESNQPHHSVHDYTPQELTDAMLPEIMTSLPSAIYRKVHIIPFLPLSKTSIEKIICLKLKILGKMLDVRHSVDLRYAPEVVRYLANDFLSRQDTGNQSGSLENVLKPLYFMVDQAVLSQLDNKNRPTQLFLQLNETGQLLRCDWLMMSAVGRGNAG